MDADLDTLCTVVYCTADDLLPEPKGNARRRTTDAEIVTLCVAQAIMGIPSDRRFLRAARRSLGHLFPELPRQAGYFKRRRHLAPVLAWRLVVFAGKSPGFYDDLLLLDSTPVECARSRETVLRSALADVCDYGFCASHSRYFWGLRLHAIFAGDGPPGPWRSPRPSAMNGRSVGNSWLLLPAEAAKSCCATRATPERSSQRPSRTWRRPWSVPGAKTSRVKVLTLPPAPTHRIHLLDVQGHSHPGTARGPYLGRPQRTRIAALSLSGRLHQSQLRTRSFQPRPGRLLLVAWNHSSRGE
jgi:hypothetical protein